MIVIREDNKPKAITELKKQLIRRAIPKRTRTMDIDDSESHSCHKVIKSEALPEKEEMNNHLISSLNKPTPKFSHTLDEFQTEMGKTCGSMNFDELLNKFLGEENQDSLKFNKIEPSYENRVTQPTILPQQESFSIHTTHCSKTLEELWSEINKNDPQLPDLHLSCCNHDATSSQETVEQITLEDFLISNGVLRKSTLLENSQSNIPDLDTKVQMGSPVDHQLSTVATNYAGNNLIENDSSTYQTFTQGSVTTGDEQFDNNEKVNCDNSASDVTEPSNKRKRKTDSVEATVARKQRRMFRNRESAARSRARKQAYTMQLEVEQIQLKGENKRLKLELKVLKEKFPKVPRMEEKLKTMRRTVSL